MNIKKTLLVLIAVCCAQGAIAQSHTNTNRLLLVDPTSSNTLTLTTAVLTANRTFTFPDVSGTILTSGSGWGVSGNSGTTAGTNFIGTTDNVAFEIHVFNTDGTPNQGSKRVMRYEANATSPNIIGGFQGNNLGTSGAVVGGTIAGGGVNGLSNAVRDNYGFVGGGRFNRTGSLDADPTNAIGSAVVGGTTNAATGTESFIGAGSGNTASGLQSIVAGGAGSTASGPNSFIGGGGTNVAGGSNAVITGGSSNTASGSASSILGGTGNNTSGVSSSILGGRGLFLNGADGSIGFLGNNFAGAKNATITAANTAFFGNVDIWIGNNDGATQADAKQLRFYTPTALNGAFPTGATNNYVAFRAPVSTTTNLNYLLTLPPDDGNTNQVLRTDGSGILSWVTMALTNFTEAINTAAPNATVPAVSMTATNAATDVDAVFASKGTGALLAQVPNSAASGGNKRNTYSVDLQMQRANASEVASGINSVVLGGRNNTASGSYSSVSGGFGAVASNYGQSSMSAGSFSASGDAQTSTFVLRNQTTDNTPTSLFLDGGSIRIPIPSSGAMTFKALIIGKVSGTAGPAGGWEVSGTIFNNGGTATIAGAVVVSTFNTPGGWAAPTVTGTGANMDVVVTGAAATTINWVCRMETAEIVF